MCGIIGIITKENLSKKLIDNLELLEYRGYDSAGISIVNNNEFVTTKQIGGVSSLAEKVDYNILGSFGIGHTRWATHGKINLNNCHPHISHSGEWAIVHNGIIENYMELKILLENKGVKFSSATDSEVVANLLSSSKAYDIKGIIAAIKQLKGSYALAMINKYIDEKIFLARKNSPLYIAKCGEDIVVSSDIVSFYDKAEEFFALDNDEFAEVSSEQIVFYDKAGKIVSKSPKKLFKTNSKTDKSGHKHFMLKEIFEVPNLLKDVYRYYTNNAEMIYDIKRLIKNCSQILLVGCGTAYHSALIAEKFLREKVNKPISTHIASEFIYDNIFINPDTLSIFISQSGETADTISALKKAKEKGSTTVAITNNINSSLAFLAEYTLPVLAGVEIAVASTKAYNCQCFVGAMLASFASGGIGYVKNFDELVFAIQSVDNGLCLDIAKSIQNEKNIYFLGRGIDYITSQEGSLKLKEISYINSVACPSGELKHGTLALIEKGTLVFMSITDKNLLDKSLVSLQEVKTRGAKVIAFSQFSEVKQYLENDDILITLPDLGGQTYQLSTTYYQLIAYYTSTLKGINPDKPRNLAKSVTVE